jgi:hypothetical protein
MFTSKDLIRFPAKSDLRVGDVRLSIRLLAQNEDLRRSSPMKKATLWKHLISYCFGKKSLLNM